MTRIRFRFRPLVASGALGAAALAASCAEVSVRKVPSPAQYVVDGVSTWTREDQAAADAMDGMRFYLPRPYVVVFESFPVATDLYLARGRVSPEGRFVTIDAVMPITSRGDLLSSNAVALPDAIRLPTDMVFRPGASLTPGQISAIGTAGAAGAAAQSGDDVEELRTLVAEAKRYSEDAKAAAALGGAGGTGGSTPAPGAATGVSKQAVTNSNGAFAYQPLRGNFDLAYLPDFDEQYVVNSKANLGNAEFQMNLGQGWSLQGFNATVDNSELNKRIFGLLDTAIAAAKAAAGAAFPPAGIGAAVADVLARPQSGDDLGATAAGTPVTLKLVIVHYAAKGLYPVIKPRELYGRVAPGVVIDVADPDGAVRLPSDDLVRAAADRFDQQSRRSTVPVYPYQYVSFNTFRYLSVEALTIDGSPFGTLYDRTGTAGEAGDRQAYDASAVISSLLGAMAQPQSGNDPGNPVPARGPAGSGPNAGAATVHATTIDAAKAQVALNSLAAPGGAGRAAVATALGSRTIKGLTLNKSGVVTARSVSAIVQVSTADVPVDPQAQTQLRDAIKAALLPVLAADRDLTAALGGRSVDTLNVQFNAS